MSTHTPNPTALRRSALVLMGATLAISAAAYAQATDGGRVYEELLRTRLDQRPPQDTETTFDAGGWFNFAWFHFEDSLEEEHTLRQYELRGWASLNLHGVHQFYVRGLAGWNDYNTGDNTYSYRDDNTNAQTIERAWYQFDLGQMLENQTGQRPEAGVKVKVGRAFADIGSALTLSMPLDMVEITSYAGDWRLKTLLGKTVDKTPNIDPSASVATQQDRCIWGAQLTYTGFSRHTPYAYFLVNEDDSSAKPELPNQTFDYSSRYVGVGSRGTVLSPNLRYLVEAVGEWGETYSRGQKYGQDDICAMAFDAQLEYLFDVRTKPKVMLEYLYGSGDSDRATSATATTGGNRHGTHDRAFNALGFRDTGIAFAPAVSNLHIFILQGSFFPFEDHKWLDKLELGSKVYFYTKDQSDGPISDTTATKNSAWVGWEFDAYANWRITSDLSWTVRYGAFRPGEAFPDVECRQFVFTGVTLSF